MIARHAVVELSSDEDVPRKKRHQRSRGTGTLPKNVTSEVISLDDDEPLTTSKIAITIEHEHKQPSNSKITIQIEDSGDRLKEVPNRLTEKTNQSAEAVAEVNRFSELMERCLAIDGSGDMQHVVHKKLRHYHKCAEPAYLSSVQFHRLVSDKIRCLSWDSANVWVHVKEVVDALRTHRTAERLPETNDEHLPEHVKSEIKRLEERMRELQKFVTDLEEQEVDLEDEEDSVYLRVERYKEKLVSVYKRLCRLRGARGPAHGRVHIERRAGQAAGPAARLEEWVNKPLAAGNVPRFPDFHDVVVCVRDAVAADRLLWSEVQIMHEARELFAACGRALQRKRQRREWRAAAALLADAPDPADGSDALRRRLAENALVARRNEKAVFDEFENKQMLHRLVAKQKEQAVNGVGDDKNYKNISGDNEVIKEAISKIIESSSIIEPEILRGDQKSEHEESDVVPKTVEREKHVELSDLKGYKKIRYEDDTSNGEVTAGVRPDLITEDHDDSDDCVVLSDESCDESCDKSSDETDRDDDRIDLRSPTPPESPEADAQSKRVENSGRAYCTRVSISSDDDSDCLVLE